MARVRLPITKKSSSLSTADSDSTSGSNQSVKSQPLSSKKRKLPAEGHEGVSNFKVPEDLYHFIREAVVLRDHLKKSNKNDMDSMMDLESAEATIRIFAEELKKINALPHNWKYDPAAAKTYECIRDINITCGKRTCVSRALENDPDNPWEGRDRCYCCAPLNVPDDWYTAKTDDVPLSRTEKKIWKEFQKFDEKISGLDGIKVHGFEKEKMPIKIDNPIVSLIGNFAIAAFNDAIKKYVKFKVSEHKNLRDFEFLKCSYIKMREAEYYFYMTIEAFEEGKLGVYETKVRLEWDDGRKSLCNFVLTDRTPRGKRKRVKRIQMTDPGDWFDPMLDKYFGMKPRSESASCMGYDYHTPWGFEGP